MEKNLKKIYIYIYIYIYILVCIYTHTHTYIDVKLNHFAVHLKYLLYFNQQSNVT